MPLCFHWTTALDEIPKSEAIALIPPHFSMTNSVNPCSLCICNLFPLESLTMNYDRTPGRVQEIQKEVYRMKVISGYDLPSQRPRRRSPVAAPKKQSAPKPAAEVAAEGWADRIREAIDASGMMDKDIAKGIVDLGYQLSARTIYNWKETGQMSQQYIAPFCQVTECDAGWLVSGYDNEPLRLVRPKDDGLEQHQLRVPLFETDDLLRKIHEVAAEDVEDFDAVLHMTDEFLSTPNSRTEIHVPFLHGHKHEEILPGNPQFAVQVTSPDYGADLDGQLMCIATDIWPMRDDWTLFLKRSIHGKMYSNWSLHAGFFRDDERTVGYAPDAWWKNATENKLDRTFRLQVEKGKESSDDVVFNFSTCQWVYLGLAVFKMGWMGRARTLSNTRLLERQTRLLNRYVRKGYRKVE
tara:strand:- start:72 stop:1298 length:1227 start_codon:yes stop_codon:yes gene_type:complete